MLIKELNQLSRHEIVQIKELVAICNRHDGLKGFIDMDASLSFNPQMNTIFLLYRDDKLGAVLTLYAPDNKEAEVSAMVLPEYRLQGCFSELLKRAMAELKKYGVSRLLFLCEAASSHGKAALKNLEANYEFTAYLLQYNHTLDEHIKKYTYKLNMCAAEPRELEEIIRMSMEIFDENYATAKSIVLDSLNRKNSKLLLGKIEGRAVGMGAFVVNGRAASINSLGLLPEYQGKGYGKEMLYFIINRLLDSKVDRINLEVSSKSQKALQLYRESGFGIVNAWAYYGKAVD